MVSTDKVEIPLCMSIYLTKRKRKVKKQKKKNMLTIIIRNLFAYQIGNFKKGWIFAEEYILFGLSKLWVYSLLSLDSKVIWNYRESFILHSRHIWIASPYPSSTLNLLHNVKKNIQVDDAIQNFPIILYGMFGWGGFGPRDLDLRAQIQILCLDDLKPLGFGFGPNPSWISKAQIHGFQMTCIARNLGNPPLRSLTSPLSLSLSHTHTSPLSSLTSPF